MKVERKCRNKRNAREEYEMVLGLDWITPGYMVGPE